MKTLSSVLRSIFVLAVLTGTGCQEDIIDFPDGFPDPPPGAADFLGYNNQDAKLAVCGTCHVGQNSEWRETAHAGAWETLQASGASEVDCEGCHSVSERGNLHEAAGGWPATLDERYQDVQCESCHGPGLDHVIDPDATKPLASLLAGTGLTNGCGECHQGNHHGFVDEWAESRHGAMTAYPQRMESCVQCHEARGALAAFGVNADYIEKDQDDPIPITCSVCHDPHDATNEHQLRFPINVPNVDLNLCMKCHHRRAVPDPDTGEGPHSPQGPLLLGQAGWRPPSFLSPTAQIVATHGTEANPDLCAGCHVNRYEVTDPASGDHVFSVTGHSFKATPCLDAQGVPLPTTDCSIEERSFAACSRSGCHSSPELAMNLLVLVRARIDLLTAELDALLAQVPASEFLIWDNIITTGEGSKFNRDLAAQQGSPLHNPFLIEALLTASIRQVEQDYGLAAPPALVLENVLADSSEW